MTTLAVSLTDDFGAEDEETELQQLQGARDKYYVARR